MEWAKFRYCSIKLKIQMSKGFLDDNGFHSLSLSQVSTSDPEAKAHKYPISSSFQISSNKEESIETEALGLRDYSILL